MRKILLPLLLAAFLTPTLSHAADDDNSAAVRSYIEKLFVAFKEIAQAQDEQIDQNLLQLYRERFDHRRIARFVLGSYARRASTPQMQRFEELLPTIMLSQLRPQIQKYFSFEDPNTITISGMRTLKRKDVVVAVEYHGKLTAKINIRIRPENGQLKILDFEVGGISMLLAQRDLMANFLKKHHGDLDLFLAELATLAEQQKVQPKSDQPDDAKPTLQKASLRVGS